MEFNTLLNNVYEELGTNKTDLLILPNPEIVKSTTSIIWKNIKEFLKITHTPPDHLIKFIQYHTGKKVNWFSESVSTGLIIHNRKMTVSDIINLMKKYVDEVIICKSCKKTNTIMYRDGELRKYRIKCNDCSSEYILTY